MQNGIETMSQTGDTHFHLKNTYKHWLLFEITTNQIEVCDQGGMLGHYF